MVDKAADIQETGISTPEDFWTPLAPPPKTAAYKEQYQPIKPPPEHDGTECLKWDDSLWSHADHIKVGHDSGGAGLRLQAQQACQWCAAAPEFMGWSKACCAAPEDRLWTELDHNKMCGLK